MSYVFRVPCASRRVASESECACECESTSPCVCVGGLGVSRSRRDPRPRALRPSASPATPWWRVDGAPARWGLGVGRGGRSPRRAAQPQGNKNNASNTAKTTDARGESSVKSRTLEVGTKSLSHAPKRRAHTNNASRTNATRRYTHTSNTRIVSKRYTTLQLMTATQLITHAIEWLWVVP